MNLILALFWLYVIIAYLVERWLQVSIFPIPLDDINPLFILIAAMMFAYNLSRWWIQRMAKRRREYERNPPPRRKIPTEEYLPEFDFDKADPKKTNETPP